MEKYFSSTYHSGLANNKSFSSFNSLIVTSPKLKKQEYSHGYKPIETKSTKNITLTFKKQLNKTTPYISSSDRLHFKSIEKKHNQNGGIKSMISDWKPNTKTFLKKKQCLSYRQIQIPDQKQLRESDSTLCQSPKAQNNVTLKISDFKKLRLIGNGKYGNVYMVKHMKTGFIAALKVIRKIDIDCLQHNQKQQMINQLIRQIKIQSCLDHPNLIKLYSFFSDDYNIYLLMELGCDGQLYDLMKKKQTFHEESVSIIIRQISEGLHYMHKNKVIHRDIKPQNIVLIHGLAKICDFGWSVFCIKQLRSTFCGTPLYLSPEILKGNMYNEKIDTWAIGTLAYELFTSQNPFKIKRKQDLSKIITEDVIMRSGSPEIRSFITFILKKDPTKRPDSGQIKNHQFIKKYLDLDTSQQICSLIYKRVSNVYSSCLK